MSKKVIFFTADAVPTTDEKNAIAALNLAGAPQYEVAVRRADVLPNYNHGPESADAVMGTIPGVAPWNAKPVYTAAKSVVITNGREITLNNGGKVTFTVVNGLITVAAYTAP